MAVTMAVSAEAMRGRYSFGDDLDADREAPERGPAQDVIAVMAGLLRDTRGSTFLGGSVLSALTIGIEIVTEAVSPSHCFRRYSHGHGHRSRLRTCAYPSV